MSNKLSLQSRHPHHQPWQLDIWLLSWQLSSKLPLSTVPPPTPPTLATVSPPTPPTLASGYSADRSATSCLYLQSHHPHHKPWQLDIWLLCWQLRSKLSLSAVSPPTPSTLETVSPPTPPTLATGYLAPLLTAPQQIFTIYSLPAHNTDPGNSLPTHTTDPGNWISGSSADSSAANCLSLSTVSPPTPPTLATGYLAPLLTAPQQIFTIYSLPAHNTDPGNSLPTTTTNPGNLISGSSADSSAANFHYLQSPRPQHRPWQQSPHHHHQPWQLDIWLFCWQLRSKLSLSTVSPPTPPTLTTVSPPTPPTLATVSPPTPPTLAPGYLGAQLTAPQQIVSIYSLPTQTTDPDNSLPTHTTNPGNWISGSSADSSAANCHYLQSPHLTTDPDNSLPTHTWHQPWQQSPHPHHRPWQQSPHLHLAPTLTTVSPPPPPTQATGYLAPLLTAPQQIFTIYSLPAHNTDPGNSLPTTTTNPGNSLPTHTTNPGNWRSGSSDDSSLL